MSSTLEECIDILYEKVSQELPITREEYVATLAGWEISQVSVCDKNVGVVMLRDREIHVVIDPKQAMLHGRRILRKCLDENIRKHGYLTTISFKEPKIVGFLERLGFYKTGEDENFFSYRIDKEKLCHL